MHFVARLQRSSAKGRGASASECWLLSVILYLVLANCGAIGKQTLPSQHSRYQHSNDTRHPTRNAASSTRSTNKLYSKHDVSLLKKSSCIVKVWNLEMFFGIAEPTPQRKSVEEVFMYSWGLEFGTVSGIAEPTIRQVCGRSLHV